MFDVLISNNKENKIFTPPWYALEKYIYIYFFLFLNLIQENQFIYISSVYLV